MAKVDPVDLELLTAHVLGQDRAWVLAHPDLRITRRQRRRFAALLNQRRRGTPIPYLLGYQEFYGRKFQVNKHVLIPRPETEHLVETAIGLIPKKRRWTVADIGTGSGCLAITLAAECQRLNVMAADNSALALRVARANAQIHGVRSRIHFFRGHLLQPLTRRGIRPDLILANLPYLTPKEYLAVSAEPKNALVGGPDGLALFKAMFRQLNQTSWTVPLILEIHPPRLRQAIRLARRLLPEVRATVERDLSGRSRVLVLQPRRQT